jgi:sarcosine oxidase
MGSDRAFDVIVLGVGGMGSAAAFELARRGRRVLGLEQFGLVHDRGSSHGRTRVIRQAYYEHPDYVPLVRRAFERWYDLEQLAGQRLLTECGCLTVGPPAGELITGVLRAAAEHRLPVERLSADDLGRRFPAFAFGDGFAGVLEQVAGFLAVEECVRAHIDAARRFGAVIHAEEPALEWQSSAGGVTVRTARDTYHAGALVVTAGPWAGRLLGELGVSLTVMRQLQFWLGPPNPEAFRRDRFPVYLAETPGGFYYGLPAIDARGHKLARHYGAPELPGPEAVERTVSAGDERPVREFVTRHLPALADAPVRDAAVCLYTLTPDRHFLIGRHPGHANVALAAGFSGHGFKFAPAVGEVLADLIETGRTGWPIGLFRIDRFAGRAAGG